MQSSDAPVQPSSLSDGLHQGVRIEDISRQLRDIESSGALKGQRMGVLRYLVTETLAGRGDDLSAKNVATDSLGIPVNDDLSSVRHQIRRLRAELADYYTELPRARAVVAIEIPDRRYAVGLGYINLAEQLEPEVVDAIRRAKTLLDQATVPTFQKATDVLEAILQQPRYKDHPLVAAIKADAHVCMALHGMPALPQLQAAESLATMAAAHYPYVWEAQIVHGYVQAALRNWDEARAAFEKVAIARKPSPTAVHPLHCAYLVSQERPDEAVSIARAALAEVNRSADRQYYSFGSAAFRAELGWNQFFNGELADAVDTLRSAQLETEHYLPQFQLAFALEAMDRPADAARAIEELPLRGLESAVTWGMKALLYGRAGAKWKCRFELTKLLVAKWVFRQHVPSSQFAIANIGLGRKRAAIHWLTKMVDEHDPATIWFGHTPVLRHVLNEPGFEEMMARLGLRWRWQRKN